MRVDISPRRLEVTPGVPQEVSITVSNTDTVIGGYVLRVLGADPSWVALEAGEISLFPDESRTVTATITVPSGLTAGERRVAIQVRELTPPESSTVDEIVLAVPENDALDVRVDPAMVTAGRNARYSLLVENSGNSIVTGQLFGLDEESKVAFTFDPEVITLAPGEHAVVDLRARSKPPFAGSPAVRVLDLRLAPPAAEDPEDAEETGRLRIGRSRRLPPPPPEEEGTPLGMATFVQKPMISRGSLSLFGLLAAVTVFAIVITLAFSRLVGQSAADRDLALEIASARDSASSTGGGTAGAAGTVRQLTSGSGVDAVTVSIFDASDTEAPIATTATGKDGTWGVKQLPAGDYKLKFQGAGFVELWYPQALDPADAETLTLETNNVQQGLDVSLGGVPASISGTVLGADVSAATITLKTPIGSAATPVADPGSSADDGATVMSAPIGADGTFELTDVPSPSVYDLVVTKKGYATSTQRVDVGAGEERGNVRITLREGDGLISGTVRSESGEPLEEVTITATAGQTTVTTMSQTGAEAGAFTLRGLPTPASFTIVANKDEYATQTLTLTLAEGQRLSGVAMTLGTSSGSLRGSISLLPDRAPLGGVLVTVTDGEQTVQTASQSTGGSGTKQGDWRVSGLALPGTYTVTFTRPDLAPETVSVELDTAGTDHRPVAERLGQGAPHRHGHDPLGRRAPRDHLAGGQWRSRGVQRDPHVGGLELPGHDRVTGQQGHEEGRVPDREPASRHLHGHRQLQRRHSRLRDHHADGRGGAGPQRPTRTGCPRDRHGRQRQ